MTEGATEAAVQPPQRHTPVHRGGANGRPGLVTRVSIALVTPFRVVLTPCGALFRIREPLPIYFRVLLPLVFVGAVLLLWTWATTGETYLARPSAVSPLDAARAELEAEYGKPLVLGPHEEHSRKIFTGEVKRWYDIATATVAGKKIDLKSPVRLDEVKSDYDLMTERLKAAIPGVRFEPPEPKPRADGRMPIERAIAPKAALAAPAAKRALDDLIGEGGYVLTEKPDGTVEISGIERVEERKISPAIVPSPKEMVDSLPALLNLRWKDWQDAKHWWQLGLPEGAPRDFGPLAALPRKAWAIPAGFFRTVGEQRTGAVTAAFSNFNKLLFEAADAAYTAAIGPGWRDWKLLHAVTWSTLRIFLGFFYAAIFAVPLGVIMGSFTKPRSLFGPLLLIGSYLPLTAMLVLTLSWWGLSEAQKIGFLAITTFVVLLPQVVMAVESIPQEHIAASLTLGATRWQQMRRVLFAGAKADIMRALRLSFAVGWTWIILAESMDPVAGLGYIIQLGERRAEHRPHIYAVILLIIGTAWIVNSIWASVEKRLYPYRSAES